MSFQEAKDRKSISYKTLLEEHQSLLDENSALKAEIQSLRARMEELGAHIGEQREANEALSESEKRYRLIFDNSLDAIILTDPRGAGKVLSANPAACRMLGWSEEYIIGKMRYPLLDPEDPATSTFLDERARSGSARTQITYRRKDGTTLIGELSSTLFTDSNGEPRSVAIIRDITERKRGEETLRYHAHLVDSVSDAIISTDKELKIRSWNKAAERMYGWQADEVIGLKGSDILQTTFPEGLSREAIARDIFEKGCWEGELIQRTKDGRDITIYAKSMAFKDEVGAVIGGVSISFDITERKRAEEAAFCVKQRLEALMNSLPVGVCFSDDSTCQTITGNPAFMAQFDIGPKDNVSAAALGNNRPSRQIRYFRMVGSSEISNFLYREPLPKIGRFRLWRQKSKCRMDAAGLPILRCTADSATCREMWLEGPSCGYVGYHRAQAGRRETA